MSIREVVLTPSYVLTTEHATSKSGQPVLVHRVTGEAFGPGDILEALPSWGWAYTPAWLAVERMAANRSEEFTSEERRFVDSFAVTVL